MVERDVYCLLIFDRLTGNGSQGCMCIVRLFLIEWHEIADAQEYCLILYNGAERNGRHGLYWLFICDRVSENGKLGFILSVYK